VPVYYADYDYIAHYGIKGQQWGVRRYQNADGSLTAAGQSRYGYKGFGKYGIVNSGSSSSTSRTTQSSDSGSSSVSTTSDSSNQSSKSEQEKRKSKYVKTGVAIAALTATAVGAYAFCKSDTGQKIISAAKDWQKNKNSEKKTYKDLVNDIKYRVTGRQYVDSYLNEGTTFKRIQTTDEFENFAFYATYKKDDQDKYKGLYTRSLTRRAENDAKAAEKLANESGLANAQQTAKELREKADNMKVYQLSLDTIKKLKVPSDENVRNITADLLKDDTFKANLEHSIADSKTKMLRPSQQILFSRAQNALKGDVNRLTSSEKQAIYKAFNLSLVYHDDQEIAAQNQFYDTLKKKGYGAILDYNDKDYSSYHAKRPMIVFDTDSVKLSAVTEVKSDIADTLYKKYNTERITKEPYANTVNLVRELGSKTVSECESYVTRKYEDYLGVSKSSGRSSRSSAQSAAVRQYRQEHPNTTLSFDQILSALNYTNT